MLLVLPFVVIPYNFMRINFPAIMNTIFLDKMTSLFVLLGIGLALLSIVVTKGCHDFKIFKRYYLLALCMLGLSEAVGIANFNVSSLPMFQPEIYYIIIELLKMIGIYANQNFMSLFSYWCNLIYLNAIYLFWTFGVSYWIYCLFYRQSHALNSILVKTSIVCFTFIAIYGLIEIAYFQGSEIAKQILIICNPFLHRIEDGYGWWPPLLWKDVIPRMRSIFAEPSYMGIYFAFMLPFLWRQAFVKETSVYKNYFLWADIVFAFTMMFLTMSRTAYGISILQVVLFIIFSVWYHRHEYYVGLRKLCISCVVGALIANGIIGISISGIGDMTNVSNNSRLGYIIATTKIGLAHPVFGAGSELFNYYVEENSPEFTKDNPEYQTWIKYFNLGGVRLAYPQICEYSTLFAKYGIIGLVTFLLPLFYAVYGLWNKLRITDSTEKFLDALLVLLSLIGMAATGFSNHINITYCYWVILGVAYVYITDDGAIEVNTSEQL